MCEYGIAMADRIEDLPIYPKVTQFWDAVNAILEIPKLRSDRHLHSEIARANNSIPSNMVEGFEQSTDRAFANFLTHSKGSLAEVLLRLKQAYFKTYITADQLAPITSSGEELAKMLGGFIKYLRRSAFRDRGSHGDGPGK
jgi:four helix bundle protein